MNITRGTAGIGAHGGPSPAAGNVAAGTPRGNTFQEELERCHLSFTRHAAERLQRRDIAFGREELARLEKAVSLARSKGAANTLVLMGRWALVVDVASRNVVTACKREGLRDGVFTRIDSAVIVDDD